MKFQVFLIMVFLLIVPFSSANASWHWSSDYKVCGLEILEKGEKCDLQSDDKNDTIDQTVKNVEKKSNEPKNTCKSEFIPIIKKTTNSFSCVKESSFKALIQRGWGINP